VSDAGYAATMTAFERLVGLSRLEVFHANDSKKPCGSRVDRHKHIGQGCLSLEPVRPIIHDPRFAGRAMLIETEKTSALSRPGLIALDPLDVGNLDALRALRRQHG